MDVIPGIWVRLLDNREELPEAARFKSGYLDPTHPAVQELIFGDVRQLVDWGYRLIKHDYSTYDLFGRWGFEMDPNVTEGEWAFYDRSKTSAEVVKDFYRLILEAADGKAVILGCNTIGHLGAGLMHASRTGDDTSGEMLERTRRMGVNTLAFRMAQHGAFFAVDADCAGTTGAVEWRYVRDFAQLVADSNTMLFLSLPPKYMDDDKIAEMRPILKTAAEGGSNFRPMDWENTDCPVEWSNGTEIKRYRWVEPNGNDHIGRR